MGNAEAHIADLSTRIEQATANSARLSTEIKVLEAEAAKNQEALDQATAIRQQQLADFNSEEKGLLESLQALKAAIVVLSKHHEGEFLQLPHTHILSVAATIQHELQSHAAFLQGVLTPSQRQAAAAFAQAPEDYFGADPTFKQSYAPQSGEIFGILRQMKETFESNLSTAQKEELANQKSYEDLKAAKEKEIAAGKEQIETKTEELADTDQKNAQAKRDLEDTKATLSADEQFLMMLKEKCQMTDQEWEERKNTRSMEMKAISQAIAILSSDDAHDTFTRTFNPAASFVQRGSAAHSKLRGQVAAALSKVAKRAHSPRLAALAVRVRLDAFTKVKKAIDDMVTQLLKEKDDEVKHRDFCIDEDHSIELQTEAKEREKMDAVAEIDSITGTLNQLTNSIEQLKGEIVEMETQMKRAGEDRDKENKEFQAAVTDQRETQTLLAEAQHALEAFYSKALLQQPKSAGPPPPPGFEAYKKNEAGAGVMGLIQQIINDAKALEAACIRSEQDAQKAYEGFVQDTRTAIDLRKRDITEKTVIKAKAEGELVAATNNKDAVLLELEHLANSNTELKQNCDFIVKNFEVRQTARDEEVEALRQAKAILSGSDFNAFLQAA
eukprot:NODE_113_length_2074_cov_395.472016.p1 GENE.NODE_113_length_2074_cov_395.472016~~NODE_113_length_2074_cov_395.472016.p1  ORF type:complete len:612 (-),score=277.50 NODE_113_length_2074_cov_395.472016:221-2056(-)